MPNRQQIVDSIAALAQKLGRTPTLHEFTAKYGITFYGITEFYSGWNDAVQAAGLRPSEGHAQVTDDELLADWGKIARRHAFVPTRHIYRREGQYAPSTITNRFGGWSHVAKAFARFAEGKPEWADVVAIVSDPLANRFRARRTKSGVSPNWPSQTDRVSRNKLIYGNPISFRGLRHEPVNEQGVILLFGMLAEELGYLIEAVQNGFPDCEAKRRISPQRWERVRIEFEFESRNFRDHGHPPDGCDVIVCWRHNWPDCPSHLEVVELSNAIKSGRNNTYLNGP